ncbi:hypothetical protein ACFSE0_10575 [Ochrobactrum teleogrylli]|uniref:Uncharacterized protein n=1 Tax=Ochrobactrum teleogrylli TaxID=2479765 RepID=A0ABY2Y962_9HYPH|nr:hypothetical protein [[Ochrobactrum] teleogrylli]TNV17741.1 hypothetical protein FIC94_06075 [[Ochrobactrum] teleogrylli]
MAKAAKPTEDTTKVPAAEPVGGPLPNNPDNTSQNGGAVQGDANSTNISPATATNDGAGNLVGPVSDQTVAALEIEIYETFPHLAAAVRRYIDAHGDVDFDAIRITAKLDGLRRGGHRHAGTNVHPLGKFEPYQLNQIFGDPDLIADLVELDD